MTYKWTHYGGGLRTGSSPAEDAIKPQLFLVWVCVPAAVGGELVYTAPVAHGPWMTDIIGEIDGEMRFTGLHFQIDPTSHSTRTMYPIVNLWTIKDSIERWRSVGVTVFFLPSLHSALHYSRAYQQRIRFATGLSRLLLPGCGTTRTTSLWHLILSNNHFKMNQ